MEGDTERKKKWERGAKIEWRVGEEGKEGEGGREEQ